MMVLDVFACSGGMAEGLRRAGLPVTVAVDHGADACASYAANIGHAPIKLDARELLRLALAGWRPGAAIDLLVADPPCVPWSRAGKRLGTDDDRDMLEVTVGLIKALRPRAYLIANVPGLDDSANLGVVQRTIGSLAQAGYCAADFTRLNAADFGVPQHRTRPFWFGHLGGPCITWPSRTHGSPEECAATTLPGIEQLVPWVTCRQALEHLPFEELGKPVRLQWKDGSGHPPNRSDEPAHVIPASMPGNGGRLLVSSSLHPPSKPGKPAGTLTTREGRGSSILVWPWDRPSTVVCAGETLAPFGRNGREGESQRGNENAVKLSEKAGAILQGFPENWVFVGKSKASRWSQIGQAVPPAVGDHVGRAMIEQLTAGIGGGR